MFKDFSPKLFFIIAAVFVVISAPLLVLLFPIFIVQTIYFDPARIVLYPNPNNFYWIIIACILLIIACIIPIIKRNKVTYSLFAFFLIGGFATLYISSMSYYLISNEQIVIKKYEQKGVYAWENVEEVVYEYVVGDFGSYTFTMRDGTQFVIEQNGQYTTDEQQKLYNAAVSYDVAFIEREKKRESLN
ncbi:hypothetical protein CSE16_18185 [Solibacillus sp. R5-41]|uniref:hypothetical protein n=1 Tax=Solibacillus sp. R5-41 TaxID=2048654 RepID=UPI000C126356|nr:hypothetical protein [Solibacillus sp. R5-41]ATP41811.1 hypothetical protein CSE16_18185 [Solibacillus sp. R5-41]